MSLSPGSCPALRAVLEKQIARLDLGDVSIAASSLSCVFLDTNQHQL